MPRAFSINTEDIKAERQRVNNDLEQFNIAHVVKMDTLTLPPMGPRDVHLRILAVSAEHNIDHAALADTVNIAEVRGGKMYPGNSALAPKLALVRSLYKLSARGAAPAISTSVPPQ